MKIVTALNSGGEFTPAHVQALKRQCDHYAPLTEFVCITNENVPGVDCIPDPNKWPGWWIKMNAFAPSMKGTILWMDLDTVLVKDIGPVVNQERLTVLRDFYRDGKRHIEGMQASLMMLPEEDRAAPWVYFSKSARTHMETYKIGGDQNQAVFRQGRRSPIRAFSIPQNSRISDEWLNRWVNCHGGRMIDFGLY